MPKAQYWTVEDIAKIFRVHAVTVRRWIVHGHLKALRLPGKTYRIPQEELDRLRAGSSV